MSAFARPLFEMSDDDYSVPFQMPGRSNGFFDLDADVGLGYPTRRADNIKVQTILGNAGDLDLAKTDGPTGWGLYTLDDAIRSYQKRNDLKADGWLRPGGPTISKMRDQFGATLGKYPAPSPREVDEHHDRLAQGEKGLLNGTYGELKLAPIPGLSAPDDDMVGSNRSMAEYLQRHRSGLADAPATLASYIRTMGTPGIVQARDFVGQWDQTKPGQGGDAIRAILSALGDAPDLQRQFFGGPIANDQPIGIRIEDMRGDRKTLEFVHGRDDVPQPPPKAFQIPTPEEEQRSRQPMDLPPLPPLSRDGLLDPDYVKAFGERLEAKRAFEEQQRANTVYDDGLLDANNWPPHLRARLLGDTQASDETNQNFSGNDQFQPANVPEATAAEFTGQDEDPDATQITEAQGRPSQRPPASTPTPSPNFREAIAAAEAGNNPIPPWDAKNPGSTAIGRYQILRGTFVDAGLKDANGNWRAGNALGVKTDAEFLASQEAQNKAFDMIMARNDKQLKSNGAYNHVGKAVDGLKDKFKITESGLLAAAHRQGARAVRDYLVRMRESEWNSQKGLNEILNSNRSPKEIESMEKAHKAIEQRLRNFANVPHR